MPRDRRRGKEDKSISHVPKRLAQKKKNKGAGSPRAEKTGKEVVHTSTLLGKGKISSAKEKKGGLPFGGVAQEREGGAIHLNKRSKIMRHQGENIGRRTCAVPRKTGEESSFRRQHLKVGSGGEAECFRGEKLISRQGRKKGPASQ